MKTTKKNVKATKKTFKPLYTIMFDPNLSIEDFAADLAYSKMECGMNLRPEEVCDIVEYEVESALFDMSTEAIFSYLEEELTERNEPWYKKIWNKITGKK